MCFFQFELIRNVVVSSTSFDLCYGSTAIIFFFIISVVGSTFDVGIILTSNIGAHTERLNLYTACRLLLYFYANPKICFGG